MRKILLVPLAFLPFVHCATLDPIPAGSCGNHVIDSAEDCDGFALEAADSGAGSAKCGLPGTATACRLLCPGGEECPKGWGCGVDHVCRQAADRYTELQEPITTGGIRLQTGDFDGDRRKDILVSGMMSPSPLAIHYFGDDGREANRFPINVPIVSPAVVRFPGDELDDIVFSAFQDVTAALGASDGALVPATYPRVVPRVEAAAVSLAALAFEDIPAQAGFGAVGVAHPEGKQSVAGMFGVGGGGKADTLLTNLYSVPTAPTTSLSQFLAGLPASGRILQKNGDKLGPEGLSSTCGEAVLPIASSGSILVLPMCRTLTKAERLAQPNAPPVTWNDLIPPFEVKLLDKVLLRKSSASAVIVVHDLDRDDRADFIINGESEGHSAPTYVLTPTVLNPGVGLGVPRRFFLGEPPDERPAGFLQSDVLAAGDIDADGAPDLLTGDAIYRGTKRTGDLGAPFTFRISAPNRTGVWTMGAMADFNGDGASEVVAATYGLPNFVFYSGNRTGFVDFSQATVTTGPLLALIVADLDGDGIPDVGLATSHKEIGADASEVDISIAYGRRQGPPEPPIRVASLKRFTQLFKIDVGGSNALAAVATSGGTTIAERSASVTAIIGTGDRYPVVPLGLDANSECATPSPTDRRRAMFVTAGPMEKKGRTDLFTLTVEECRRPNDTAATRILRPWIATGTEVNGLPQESAALGAPVMGAKPTVAADLLNTLWVTSATQKDGLIQVVTLSHKEGGPGKPVGIDVTLHVPRVTGKTSAVESKVIATIAEAPGDDISAKAELIDVDQDGNVDLLVSTGVPRPESTIKVGEKKNAASGKLFVLYQDAGGTFAGPVQVTFEPTVTAADPACQVPGVVSSFGRFSADAEGKPRILIATTYFEKGATGDIRRKCVYGAQISRASGRASLKSLDLAKLGEVRDVISGDFTGDGVDDIAIVDKDFVRLFKGEARRQ